MMIDMITKTDIKVLIEKEEQKVKDLEEEAIRTKDCMYEIGVFGARANIGFLKEAMDGKIKLTKAEVSSAIIKHEKLQDDLKSGKFEDIDASTMQQGTIIAVFRVDLLKEIQEKFYTEIKHRVSRKQRISTLENEIDVISKKMNSIKDFLAQEKDIRITDGHGFICHVKKGDGSNEMIYCSLYYFSNDHCGKCNTFIDIIKPTGYFELENELASKKNELAELVELEKQKKSEASVSS